MRGQDHAISVAIVVESDGDARDLLMEYGYSGLDATRKVAEMKPRGRVELAEPGAPGPQVFLIFEDGRWATSRQR